MGIGGRDCGQLLRAAAFEARLRGNMGEREFMSLDMFESALVGRRKSSWRKFGRKWENKEGEE